MFCISISQSPEKSSLGKKKRGCIAFFYDKCKLACYLAAQLD
jgi:hypothetical protein